MQSLQVKIDIPDTHVVIERTEYDALKKNEHTGKYLSMKELCELTGKSSNWLKDNLLEHPARRKRIKDFTYYPAPGEHWAFKATEMRNFLEEEFLHILRRN